MTRDRSTAPVRTAAREGAAWSASSEPERSAEDVVPEVVGRYRVIERLGGGGQGVVYEAHDPKLDRRVAVKLLRRGPDRREARIRLLREANALAQLSHPNVVAVHDVGECAEGIFIVTQLVPGVTLGQWLESHRDVRTIVRGFIAAGRGLEAAHARGIVHRDFKPANVLVGDDGIVRLVDFGLARDAPEDDGPSGVMETGVWGSSGSLTQPGYAMGTPAYMAPEQHDGLPVTAAADQYAFCVALFEALVGQRPFLGRTQSALATQKRAGVLPPARRSDGVPPRLRRVLVRGLSPRPERRWPSMTDLVRALERSLDPPRRAPQAIAGAAVVLGAALWVAWPQAPEPSSCDAAEMWSEVWSDQRALALERTFSASGLAFADDAASRVRASVDALGGAWIAEREAACADVEVQREADTRIACLDAQLRELDTMLGVIEQPEPGVIEHAGASLRALPRPASCRASELPRPDATIAPAVAEARLSLARARALELAGRFDDAQAQLDAAVPRVRSLEFAPLEVELANTQASILRSALDFPGARRRAEEAYLGAQALGIDAIAFRSALMLVDLVGGQGDEKAEAQEWLRRAEATLDRMGDAADPVLEGQLGIARAEFLEGAGEYAAALEAAREAAALLEAELGSDDPQVASAMSTVASLLLLLGNPEDAEAEARRAVAASEAAVGPDHPQTGMALRFVGLALKHQGEFAEALEIQRRVLANQEAAYGSGSPRVAGSLLNIGVLHSEMGRANEAEQVYRRALEIQRRELGREHIDCARTLHNLAITLRDLGRIDEAVEAWTEAVAIGEQQLPPEHPLLGAFLGGLGALTANYVDAAQGLALLERSLVIHRATLGDEHPLVADQLARLAFAKRRTGDVAGARTDIDRALEIGEAALGPEHPDVARMRYELANVLDAEGRIEDAIAENEVAIAVIERTLGRDHTALGELLASQATWLQAVGREREGTRTRERAAAIFAAAQRSTQ